MRVLLAALHCGSFRNFESVVEALAARGHDVILLADEAEAFGGQQLVESLTARLPSVRWAFAPSYDDETWFPVARKIRQGLDYLRFLEPRYRDFPKLADRLAPRVPQGLLRALVVPGARSTVVRSLMCRWLRALDAGMPTNAAMDAFLAHTRPDVVLLASVTNPRAPQLDHLRSARALGIPTGVCVYSWDHLSSKAHIRVLPDRVLVWNDTQRQEAVALHGLPADRIVVTGAQVYDQWFDRRPSRSRDAHAQAVGLPADRVHLLYVCSALTPDPGESRFVKQWMEALRQSSDPRLREAAILIRPHPERRREWDGVDWSALGPVVIAGENPLTSAAKADYFDALHYSRAVVGLVTSAFLEAAIAGTPVLTITPPHLRIHQEGMLHFRYLLEVAGGLPKVARSIDEHLTQLAAVLDGDPAQVARQQQFLESFVRPRGLSEPATPVFVNAVETLAQMTPARLARAGHFARLLAWSAVRSSRMPLVERWWFDAREAAADRERRHALAIVRNQERGQTGAERRTVPNGPSVPPSGAVSERVLVKISAERRKRLDKAHRIRTKRRQRLKYLAGRAGARLLDLVRPRA